MRVLAVMSSQSLRVAWRADAQVSARSKSIERQLRRFRPEVNRAVRALAARDSRLADLTVSFPALAVALALPRPRVSSGAAIAAAIAGWPLNELAHMAGLPLWTRRLQPEYFSGPVPQLPKSADFYRRIANHLPKDRDAAEWLAAVSFAARWGSEPYAVWMARVFTPVRSRRRRNHFRHQVLALWAFYSAHPGTFAHSLIDRAWTPAIGQRAALDAAYTWWDAVDLHVHLGDALIGDPWLVPAEVDGFRFEPLLSAGEILQEARLMKNCLRTYGPDLSQNHGRLWSIRREGRRIATMLIRQPWQAKLLNIYELLGPRNRPVSAEVWWASQQWLHAHDLAELSQRANPTMGSFDLPTWRKLWKPFWMARQRVPSWLPLAPSESALNAL